MPCLAAEELRVTERALRRNPKSYGAWHHRKWALREQGPARADLPRELALCAQLLAADERNFHCWNFRRHATHRLWLPIHPADASSRHACPQVCCSLGWRVAVDRARLRVRQDRRQLLKLQRLALPQRAAAVVAGRQRRTR
jgi:hypothetical protein